MARRAIPLPIISTPSAAIVEILAPSVTVVTTIRTRLLYHTGFTDRRPAPQGGSVTLDHPLAC